MDLRDLNLVSVIVRMLLAFLCGGMIGLERETKRKPAGLRTHILICLGACMTTLTSQFLQPHRPVRLQSVTHLLASLPVQVRHFPFDVLCHSP